MAGDRMEPGRMSTRVTLEFVTDEDTADLQLFLNDVTDNQMLNSSDNEEGQMITFRVFRFRTEQA